ncbi:hypothetical protein BWQ96_10518 [Gracilariopsis chorda]|uniref:Protein sel-1-like n=1 Tax=Gracilariopsis chorda TaxID=448386 RepID=A0A2V3ICF5_9FLOR|nr:hypothetical protein BWQ96_10518 [Gracilariopsis chorda]|eukprot:PXF39775.1 hypothetical protein BWQ96_10518 [Gracilariopsis chorda]
MATSSSRSLKKPTEAQLLELQYEGEIKESNSVDALLALSDLLMKGAPGVKQDPVRAHQLLRRAAKQHRSARTLQRLATAGWSTEPRTSPDSGFPKTTAAESLELLQESLEMEDTPRALCDMAWLIGAPRPRTGVRKDPIRAIQLLERAIAHSHPPPAEFLHKLAYLLFVGDGSHIDPIRAVSCYKSCVELSLDPIAMFNLGYLYHFGKPPLKPCLKRARWWYERVLQLEKCLNTMYFLACILCESTQPGDVERAREMLEEIISRVHYEPAVMLLASM